MCFEAQRKSSPWWFLWLVKRNIWSQFSFYPACPVWLCWFSSLGRARDLWCTLLWLCRLALHLLPHCPKPFICPEIQIGAHTSHVQKATFSLLSSASRSPCRNTHHGGLCGPHCVVFCRGARTARRTVRRTQTAMPAAGFLGGRRAWKKS